MYLISIYKILCKDTSKSNSSYENGLSLQNKKISSNPLGGDEFFIDFSVKRRKAALSRI